jgi:hypothetical protein
MHPKAPDELHAYNVRSNQTLRWNAWVRAGGRGKRGLDSKSGRSGSFWLKASGSPASTSCRVPMSRCRRATRRPWISGCSSASRGCGVSTPSWRQVARRNGCSACSTVSTGRSGRWATAVPSPCTTTMIRAARLSRGEPPGVVRETRKRHRVCKPSGHFSRAIAADARGRLVSFPGLTSNRVGRPRIEDSWPRSRRKIRGNPRDLHPFRAARHAYVVGFYFPAIDRYDSEKGALCRKQQNCATYT